MWKIIMNIQSFVWRLNLTRPQQFSDLWSSQYNERSELCCSYDTLWCVNLLFRVNVVYNWCRWGTDFSVWTPAFAPNSCVSFLPSRSQAVQSNIYHTVLFGLLTSLSLFLPSVVRAWGQSSTVIMADESDMRNELADLQTRADQIADEVQ